MALLVPLLVALLAVAAFFLGVFDRPPFEYHDALLAGDPAADDLVAIVATARDRAIGDKVGPLLEAVEAAIRAAPEGADILAAAAEAYGGGAAGQTALGLFFDDPRSEAAPRWAVGYAVATDPRRAGFIAAHGATAGLPDGTALRAVRIPNGRVLKASVPWRSQLTHMVAPMLHWDRGLSQYVKDHGESKKLALEVYVKGPAGERRTIDYIVYPDPSVPLQDAFGTDEEEEEEEAAEEERMTEETEEEAIDEAEAEPEEESFEEERQEEEHEEEHEEEAEGAEAEEYQEEEE